MKKKDPFLQDYRTKKIASKKQLKTSDINNDSDMNVEILNERISLSIT